MLALYIFGDNIEDRLGHGSYLIFYLVCCLVAGLTHVLFSPTSPVLSIGASGAISGVMGAYFLLFPTARVITLIPLGSLGLPVRNPIFRRRKSTTG